MAVMVVTIDTPELGDRSYLVHDGRNGLVVDPQRDVERLLAAAEAAEVEITHVAETHIHNDYLSGGLELARITGAEYLVAAAEAVAFDRTPIAPGERLSVGSLSLEVIATPGHTPHHLAYLVSAPGEGAVVCTGGSLLYGAVGRTDLLGQALAAELAAAQYRSVRALAGRLDGETAILPTHGFGSFCATGRSLAVREGGTIAEERLENPALSEDDESRFVARLLESYTPFPRYYARMGPLNRSGVAAMPGRPELLQPEVLAEHLEQGRLVVDLRHRQAFAGCHLLGTLDFELSQQFTTYLGWVLPAEADLVLIGASEVELDEAMRCLGRIGRAVAGVLAGEPSALSASSGVALRSFPVAAFAELSATIAAGQDPVVLDVRGTDEWEAGHVEGARHCFVGDLPEALDELPAGPLWVYCASGYRASVAASLLERSGRGVVLVDDEWGNARAAGVPVTPPAPGRAAPL